MGRADNPPLPDPSERTHTILLVEDEVLIRLSLVDHLEECGFRVLEAANAAQAVRVIETGETNIDFVFSDVRMPGEMDGFGLSRWVKANHPDLPIVLASADATKADLARELCANEQFFAKPYDMNVVVAHIREVLAADRCVSPLGPSPP